MEGGSQSVLCHICFTLLSEAQEARVKGIKITSTPALLRVSESIMVPERLERGFLQLNCFSSAVKLM